MMKAQGSSKFIWHALLICMAQSMASATEASNIYSAEQLAASVYACVVGGQPVFSDQPCAKDAVQREIAVSNRMDAQDTSILNRHEPAPKRRTESGSDDTEHKKAACNKLRAQQAEIQERMRAGYTAPQGERMRQQLSKLAASYATQRCERYR